MTTDTRKPPKYDRRRHGFVLTCFFCLADHTESVKAAKVLGWTRIELFEDYHEYDAFWTHLGLCPHPDCHAEAVRCGMITEDPK